ncbi:MAG: DUF4157 domain-containing protein [Proteobacteria bacterium]|nr:DUF4157 domain-containing protein [Pseudomonadota bacterium]
MNAPLSRHILRTPEHRAMAAPVRTPVPVMPQRAMAGGLTVSSPHDAAEREAVQVARRVVSLPAAPVSASATRFAGLVPATTQRAPAPATAAAARPAPAAAAALPTGGQPLPRSLRDFMEPRFGADFSAVRIHTGPQAAQASRRLNAAAFTVGREIFFGRDAYQPDSAAGRELIAHELTHTIQQGGAAQTPAQVRRSLLPGVVEHSPPAVQRLGISDALDYFADHANNLPGFRMFTLVLGVNPINMRAVERTPANLLRAVVELMPGGALITQALDNHGIIDRVAVWVQQQIATLGLIGSSIRQAVDRFLDSLGWRDIFDLGGVWERAKRIVTEPISRITSFVGNLVSGVLQFIRDAILRPLAGLAAGTRGWDLLCAVLGRNPITGDPVPRTAETLIGGFMKLIGQDEVWENIQKGNAIARAWAWFQGALAGLMGFVTALPGMFMDTLRSLGVSDLLTLPQTFVRIARVFGDFAGRFFGWAGQQVISLLEIIFEVVAPSVMPYLRRTAGALQSIFRNPLGFVRNLVRAARAGFEGFVDRIGTHLKTGLIEWLTGSLPGIYIPQKLELQEILKFVLSVLGLTWQNIRQKLVTAVGEPVVKAMETGFDVVVALVTGGPAAAWDKIKEMLGNLKDMVIGGISDFVIDMVVKKAVPKLVAMFIPGAGFISAILSIYDTVMVFVSKLAQIAQTVKAFVDSIVAIAGGAIDAAAKRVESTLANLLSLAISFLAGFIGLGKVADKVMAVIQKIRAPIDKALDWLVGWIVKIGKALYGKAKAAVGKVVEWWKERKPFRTAGGESHEVYFTGDENKPVPMVASKNPKPILSKLDQYAAMAKEADASKARKNALAVIGRVRQTLATTPESPTVVADMKTLFEAFEETGAPKKTSFLSQVQTGLGGSQVAVHMSIDWLDAKYAGAHGSGPGSSALSAVMNQLVTDPGESAERKYIKGHLLNDKLGGEGDDKNLFPITAIANSRHRYSTESTVLGWLKKKNSWVWYEVKVGIVASSFPVPGKKSPRNFVNADFNCYAIRKNEDGEQQEAFTSTIASRQGARPDAEVFDLGK